MRFSGTTTGKHLGPRAEGHKGDLPALRVDAGGNAMNAVIAPRLKLADVKGRSIMIHAGGDNYSDQPSPLGGGGARIACGVVKYNLPRVLILAHTLKPMLPMSAFGT